MAVVSEKATNSVNIGEKYQYRNSRDSMLKIGSCYSKCMGKSQSRVLEKLQLFGGDNKQIRIQ